MKRSKIIYALIILLISALTACSINNKIKDTDNNIADNNVAEDDNTNKEVITDNDDSDENSEGPFEPIVINTDIPPTYSVVEDSVRKLAGNSYTFYSLWPTLKLSSNDEIYHANAYFISIPEYLEFNIDTSFSIIPWGDSYNFPELPPSSFVELALKAGKLGTYDAENIIRSNGNIVYKISDTEYLFLEEEIYPDADLGFCAVLVLSFTTIPTSEDLDVMCNSYLASISGDSYLWRVDLDRNSLYYAIYSGLTGYYPKNYIAIYCPRYPLDSWDEFKMTITDSTDNIFDDLITLTDFPKVDFEEYISENEYVPYTLNERRVYGEDEYPQIYNYRIYQIAENRYLHFYFSHSRGVGDMYSQGYLNNK
ncbi:MULTISPECIES: hypothetical protein [unclassified Sedimentibacter]|uniref:hypothetical protein n=1 Tax=unclassified Sedimentibacter TaxID=2649220 RepID=UPI0027E0CC44|nr:hypothetical protein [Sedimentibacter sp. MB35-C1]WMJ76010.1 hypothetical protein RBQ61_10240 [Sedimentibacter sp. MB35-C1]